MASSSSRAQSFAASTPEEHVPEDRHAPLPIPLMNFGHNPISLRPDSAMHSWKRAFAGMEMHALLLMANMSSAMLHNPSAVSNNQRTKSRPCLSSRCRAPCLSTLSWLRLNSLDATSFIQFRPPSSTSKCQRARLMSTCKMLTRTSHQTPAAHKKQAVLFFHSASRHHQHLLPVAPNPKLALWSLWDPKSFGMLVVSSSRTPSSLLRRQKLSASRGPPLPQVSSRGKVPRGLHKQACPACMRSCPRWQV